MNKLLVLSMPIIKIGKLLLVNLMICTTQIIVSEVRMKMDFLIV